MRFAVPVMLALVGCNCEDFAAVQVAGAPAGVVDAVQGISDAFADETSQSSCLQIEVTDNPDVGSYGRVSRNVQIDSGAAPLREVVRHELCHAVDLQNGLSAAHSNDFAERAMADEYPTKSRARWEGFANACQRGGLPIRLATDVTCNDDPVAEVWNHLRADVFDRPLPRHTSVPGLEFETMGAFALQGTDPVPLGCIGGPSGVLVVWQTATNPQRYVMLDPREAHPISLATSLAGGQALRVNPSLPGYWSSVSAVQLGTTVIAPARWNDQDESMRRFLVKQDGKWGVSDECGWVPDCSFAIEDEIWMGRFDDDRFVWGRWVP